MIATKVAIRYAKALLQLAVEQNQLDKVFSDMETFYQTCNESHELEVMLKSPVINHDKKLDILSALFKKEFSPLSFAFIELITKKQRESILHQIALAFINLYKEHKNIVTASVTSAIPLDAKIKQEILGILAKDGEEIEIEEKVNPDIIGGFIIRIKDKQIDASVKHKLEVMKNSFTGNLYIKDF
jgi:F-type H+-transporting ATPase subunit delta